MAPSLYYFTFPSLVTWSQEMVGDGRRISGGTNTMICSPEKLRDEDGIGIGARKALV